MIYVVTGLNPEPWTAGSFARMKGKTVVYKDEKLKTYQLALKDELAGAQMERSETLHLRLAFWRDTTGGQPADATNLQKATEDGLQGVLFKNDRAVRSISTAIVDQRPGADSGLIIEIQETPFSAAWWPLELPARAVADVGVDQLRRANYDPSEVF